MLFTYTDQGPFQELIAILIILYSLNLGFTAHQYKKKKHTESKDINFYPSIQTNAQTMTGYYGVFSTYMFVCMLNTLYLLNYLYSISWLKCAIITYFRSISLRNSPQNVRGNTSVNRAWSGGLVYKLPWWLQYNLEGCYFSSCSRNWNLLELYRNDIYFNHTYFC